MHYSINSLIRVNFFPSQAHLLSFWYCRPTVVINTFETILASETKVKVNVQLSFDEINLLLTLIIPRDAHATFVWFQSIFLSIIRYK